MPGNCLFNDDWLKDNKFSVWIVKHEDDLHVAHCKLCKKDVDISSMGKSALYSHMRGLKHSQKVRVLDTNLRLSNFTITPSKEISSLNSASTSTSLSSATEIDSTSSVLPRTYNPTTKNDIMKAEIWWALKTVNSSYSFKSSEDMSFLWKNQFPDSQIAQKATCGETKCMYLTCYGLAPYFKHQLRRNLSDKPFVLLFDESLNHELQKKQMDLLVRFWDHESVKSRYFTSVFLGHATAADMLNVFSEHVEQLGYQHLIQLSMDGPNVNWSLHDKLSSKIDSIHHQKLLNIGSCGLHITHNAFKYGINETGWDIPYFLSCLYTLFHDTAARRADYDEVTVGSPGGNIYPKKFCNHRWLENVSVAQRAIDMLPSLRCYMEAIIKGKLKAPDTKSYKCVKSACKDNLIEAKLAFFICVAKPLEIFLTTYQTDRVMVPFLSDDLDKLVRNLMVRICKEQIIRAATNTKKLSLIDIEDNLIPTKKVDVGFVAERLLVNLVKKKKISELQSMEFKNACKSCILVI